MILFHCSLFANCPHGKAETCVYAKPHTHGGYDVPVSLWCREGDGAEMIDCVEVKPKGQVNEQP